MAHPHAQIARIARRAASKVKLLSSDIEAQRKEFSESGYYRTFSRSQLYDLPGFTKAIVEKAVREMEEQGYTFGKRQAGKNEVYCITVDQVRDIYKHRGIETYKERFGDAFVIFIGNLKGGVTKTVTSVTVAHAFRVHPMLIKENIRALVIDLDPQASGTMFLNHLYASKSNEYTAAQAMLREPTEEEIGHFIFSSGIEGVDVMPASIEDAFLASDWEDLCKEHLPGQNPHTVLRDKIIDIVRDRYDFIFVDSGPHLDAFLNNSLAAADLLMTPIPPAQVDFHSTLKYLERLPELFQIQEEDGVEPRPLINLGFMSKLIEKKPDHVTVHSMAKEVFGGDMLDKWIPRLDAFERCGESFDTVISANPKHYPGSKEALKQAKEAAEEFAKSVFDRIEYIRDSE
ncbi:AAA family ATPase [Neiella sp. HB171785]|uniref:AAA family ATPase n=1 Tax=Neiella litorisoli TaxID=2771431 RepID=A0A8J6ULS2_9GAMM|nr:AAA family ATPase [Neiella litorisoli]MBD1389445.1 AAA family ATPase [Neiella litorisoli]